MPTDTSLYVPLGKRPEATTITVRALIKRVQQGEIRLPDFQRPLRWSAADVNKLFDSLWRGYPIGSLLFWKRAADADPAIPVGSAHVSAPAMSDAWFVVDGQQRTTALAASLLDLPQGRDRRWSIWFDPDLPGFVEGPPSPEQKGVWVPGSALGDLRRLNAWVRDARVSDEAWGRIEEAQQRLLDYAFPVYVVETDDARALRGVFARMNSTGATMRADEVFQALLGDDGDEHGALDLNALQIRCDLNHFGVPPRGEVLKAVLAMSGLDPSRRLQDLNQPEIARLVSKVDAEESLERTVGFLQQDCGIPHVRLIPYPVVFSILARWFHVFPETDSEGRAVLARWVWQGASTGAHQRSAVSKMREQVSAVVTGDLAGSLQRLRVHVSAPRPGVWHLQPFNSKSAVSRIETLALLSLRPSSPSGEMSLLAMDSEDRIAKEVFASPDWAGLEDADKMLAKSAANRVLLDEGHTGLHAELRAWTDLATLATHLIDAETLEALKERDIPAFLRRRGDQVARLVRNFLDDKVGHARPNLLPEGAYLEDHDA